MGLETGVYIDDLVATNPTSGDLKSQGDDHIRLIKATIKASFPNIAGAVTLTHGQLSGVDTPLTGTPTAPTASLGNNSTQIATTAYVDATTVAGIYPPIGAGTNGQVISNDGTTATWIDVYTEAEIDANTYTRTWIDANLYTQTAADALLDLKADLASPALTGTPTAPTAAASTNTTQIATTEFVTTADDLKADLASPALTGTPTAPTAAVGTDTTQVATTAFVKANTFYNAYVMVSDRKAQATPGGTFTQAVWQKRDINTEDADTEGIASIATNQITLAAGTYRCLINCPARDVQQTQARLYDTTGSTVLLEGQSHRAETDNYNIMCAVVGRFTLAVESVLEIQHKCLTTAATSGFGAVANLSTEVYTVAEFWRES